MASYPGALKTYTNKVDGVDTVLAADMNSVQAEIQAIEGELGTNPKTSALPASAGTYSASGTNTTVAARLTNL
jgi:anti-sigma factor ChrR (cupin superfamily)